MKPSLTTRNSWELSGKKMPKHCLCVWWGGGGVGWGVWDQGIPAVPQKWAYLPVFP